MLVLGSAGAYNNKAGGVGNVLRNVKRGAVASLQRSRLVSCGVVLEGHCGRCLVLLGVDGCEPP